MARIEDYALLSDMHSGALVSTDGSIDWLTFPRFDSAACFASLLGELGHTVRNLDGGYLTWQASIRARALAEDA